MKQNKIAFDNLRAEMARKNIGIKDMAEACEFNRDTLARKLSKKSPLNLDEAFLIQRTLFPGQDIRYLFCDLPDTEKADREAAYWLGANVQRPQSGEKGVI